jgi:hypothetical protein
VAVNRFAWLLVLPYVVVQATGPMNCIDSSAHAAHCVSPRIDFKGKAWLGCDPLETCEDVADALNDAHERRTHVSSIKDVETSQDTNSLYWKDSNKAEWEDKKPVYSSGYKRQEYIDLPPLPITKKEACGQDDCGKDSQ